MEISLEVLKQLGFAEYKRILSNQLADLSIEERILWLDNLKFMWTPDLREIFAKLTIVRDWASMGQRRHFSIGGRSGMGKTTLMEWYVLHNTPTVKARRNHVPAALIQAPVTNRSPLPLLRRMTRPFGKLYVNDLQEEDLLDLLVTLVYACRTDVLMIDEAGNIHSWDLKRRLIDFSNEATRLVIVCASVSPVKWLNGDEELEGRFDDIHVIEPYKGGRLRELLTLIELILGFRSSDDSTSDGNLNTSLAACYVSLIDPEIMVLIEQWTDGILRDIIALVYDAAKDAIVKGQAGITREGLEAASKRLKKGSVSKIKRNLLDQKRKHHKAQ